MALLLDLNNGACFVPFSWAWLCHRPKNELVQWFKLSFDCLQRNVCFLASGLMSCSNKIINWNVSEPHKRQEAIVTVSSSWPFCCPPSQCFSKVCCCISFKRSRGAVIHSCSTSVNQNQNAPVCGNLRRYKMQVTGRRRVFKCELIYWMNTESCKSLLSRCHKLLKGKKRVSIDERTGSEVTTEMNKLPPPLDRAAPPVQTSCIPEQHGDNRVAVGAKAAQPCAKDTDKTS